MTTFFEIKNNWDNRTFCGLDMAWVNDGRQSACFATKELAEQTFNLLPAEDQDRCEICEFEAGDY